MKQTKKILLAITMAATALNSNVLAQTWGTSSAPTFTLSSVGIGASATPGDSWLHIYGLPQYYSCSGSLTPGGQYNPIPELWIDRQLPHVSTGTCTAPPSANLFQTSASDGLATYFFDVINASGWLGILQTNPSQPLDVAGNGLIEQNLAVNGTGAFGTTTITGTDEVTVNGVIGMYDPSDAPYARAIHGNSNNGGLCLYAKDSYTDGSGIEIWAPSSPYNGQIHLLSYNGSPCNSVCPGFDFINGHTGKNIMLVNQDGSVQIAGPTHDATSLTMDGNYGLYVGQGIMTERLKIAILGSTDWSDFVFNKTTISCHLAK
jgi:hypothetical protein